MDWFRVEVLARQVSMCLSSVDDIDSRGCKVMNQFGTGHQKEVDFEFIIIGLEILEKIKIITF